MSSLADKAILSGADNRPPMLKKDMYDSCRSRMELYTLNKQHGRMILESVEHGPLLWPTVEEDGVTRLKKYSELSTAEAIQADYDVKETNIILQVLPLEIYALLRTSLNPRQQATINNGRVTIQPIQGRQNFVSVGSSRPFTSRSVGAPGKQRVIVYYNYKSEGRMSKQCTKPKRKRDAEWFKDKVLLVQAQANGQYMNESQSNTVQNLTLPALQDDIIVSVIEQLKTQVVTCIKINQDNKHVNDLLTAKLERYRSQERVLNELKHDEKASTSYESSQKEESRNIDRELALEKQVKELN
nr:hypothetical protein [Tanacetum cinerariifolium]